MTIRLKQKNGNLDTMEFVHLKHHIAFPHLQRFLNVKGFKQCKSIKKISVECSNLNNRDYNALHDILKLSSEINEISFCANHIESHDVAYLLDCLPSKELHAVKFVDNWIGDKIPFDFFSFLKNKKLTRLDLSLNWLRDRGIKLLLEAMEETVHLEELVLSCNDFGIEGLRALRCFVLKHPSLKALNISYNNFNEGCIKEISTMITESHSLTSLDIRSNKIRDKGLEFIIHALKYNTHLKQIDLSDNEITKLKIAQLVEVAEAHNRLQYLILKHNPLTPSVLRASRADLQIII